MDRDASWVAEQLKEFDLLWDAANEIGGHFGRFGNPNDIIKLVSRLSLSARHELFPGMLESLQISEKTTGRKIERTNLEEWIKGAQDPVRREVEATVGACKLLKIDVTDLGLDDACTKISEHPL